MLKDTSRSSDLTAARRSYRKARGSRPLPAFLRFPASVNGTIFNAVSGHPLVGVDIKFRRIGATAAAKHKTKRKSGEDQRPQLLGEARTDTSGYFIIRLAEAPVTKERLIASKKEPRPFFTLVVEGQGGKELASHQFSLRDLSLYVAIPVSLPDVRIPVSIWQTIAERAEGNRIGQLHSLLRELVLLPPEHSLFGDLSLEIRHAVGWAFEQAFLDPNGLLRSYGLTPSFRALRAQTLSEKYIEKLGKAMQDPKVQMEFGRLLAKTEVFKDISSVDWAMDLRSLGTGDCAKAVSAFEDVYTGVGATHIDLPTKESRYRDYLRTIYTGPADSPKFLERKATLNRRFHQNFATLDNDERPANEILITIAKEILTSPTGNGYGFGILSANIEPRGDRSLREYLDYLIGLTGISSPELGLRYRIDLSRPDSALSSRIKENIGTLQRFYADGFQSVKDPYPILGDQFHGRAPFFLHYDEWLHQTETFFAENYYQIEQTARPRTAERWLPKIKDYLETYKGNAPYNWVAFIVGAEEKLKEGSTLMAQREYKMAQERFTEAEGAASEALQALHDEGTDLLETVGSRLAQIRDMPMNSMEDLTLFVDGFCPYPFQGTQEVEPISEVGTWIFEHVESFQIELVHMYYFVIPTCLGDVALALGHFSEAVSNYEKVSRFLLARANVDDPEGYRDYYYPQREIIPDLEQFPKEVPSLYKIGALPYTTPRFSKYDEISSDPVALLVVLCKDYLHPMEKRFFALRHGNAMLEWADALYRSNEPANIARAREIYKAVLWLHSTNPKVSPAWGGPQPMEFHHHHENPAVVSQRARARLGLSQIESGLNFYGLTDLFVPPLRYRVLKDTADRFTSIAKSAQQDFLLYMEKIEEILRDNIVSASMLKKAVLQAQIAGQQKQIAEFNVLLAQKQVQQVQAAYEAKKEEIESHDNIFTQLGEFIGGIVGVFTGGLTGKIGSYAGAGVESGVSAGGYAGAGGIMAGYGLFLYGGYTSLSDMESARSSRMQELAALRTEAMPLAMANVAAREAEVRIAELQRQIAEADAELARALMQFQSERFLNIEFWSHLATVMNRVMRRFLELAGRFAWLAERALAYELDSPLNVIRFDYAPAQFQDVSGADLLQLDLGTLEATRLERLKQSVPVRHTYSLAFDFPLHFAQLKRTGVCTFMTREQLFRLGYPGTYGYRLRSVTAMAKSLQPMARVKGLLINQGVSWLSRSDGNSRVSLRNAEALPLSEFHLQRDMGIYELPGEALMPFEGIGVETFWTLELPLSADAESLGALADIEITLNAQACYSPELHAEHVAAMPSSVRRFVFMSARVAEPTTLDDLRGDEQTVTFPFSLGTLGLAEAEQNRKVANVVLFVVTREKLNMIVTVGAQTPATQWSISLENGIALSNAPPLTDPENPSLPQPLNGLVGLSADQTFTVIIDKTLNPAADFSGVADVVLGLEYTADLTS